MTRPIGPNDGFQVVRQLGAALGGNGTARSFVQQRLDSLFRWVNRASTWQSYTPTLTNLTLGNGTLIGQYNRVGNTVHFYVIVVFGSTTSVVGPVLVTVPFPMVVSTYQSSLFTGMLEDASGSPDFVCFGFRNTLTNFQVTCLGVGGTHAGYNSLAATTPFTWTTSDRITIGGTYQTSD